MSNSDTSPTGGDTGWRRIADDVAVMSFPFQVFGIDFKRNVTLLRLSDRRVVIHSTAPFTKEDVAAIREFGQPAVLVEATLLHDTFAKEGRAAFPDLPYLAPSGFEKVSGIATQPLDPPPSAWAGEVDVLKIDGTKKKEHALFHRQSRTLVVADLFFSFPRDTRGWPRFFALHFMGLPETLFGVSRFFRLLIDDKQALQRSLEALLRLSFERIVVAHWAPIESAAKPAVERALRAAGF